MNNPLRGSHRLLVCHGTAFPLAILAWTIFFFLPRSGAGHREHIPWQEEATSLDKALPQPSISRAVCFPLVVSDASLHCETRTAGSILPLSGAARLFPWTSVTNCNHHERGRAGSASLSGERTCFGTPSFPLPRGAAPVPLSFNHTHSVRLPHSVSPLKAGWTGP